MSAEGGSRLTDLIRVYDNALDPGLCRRVIDLFEADTEGQFRRPRQDTWVENIVTRNPRPEWRDIERSLVENMARHLRDYASAPEAGMLSRKIPGAFEHLKIKKYSAGESSPDRFPLHFDAFDHKTSVRIVAFLWYLNTLEEGGETVFPVLGERIPPREGRLLMFPPMWMYEHSGEPPVSADKYIVTSYLNFQDPEDAFRFSYPIR
jgi:prolyl 4-hydroxylase